MLREYFHPAKSDQAAQKLTGIRSPTGQVAKPPTSRPLPNGASSAAQDAVARCQVDPGLTTSLTVDAEGSADATHGLRWHVNADMRCLSAEMRSLPRPRTVRQEEMED